MHAEAHEWLHPLKIFFDINSLLSEGQETTVKNCYPSFSPESCLLAQHLIFN